VHSAGGLHPQQTSAAWLGDLERVIWSSSKRKQLPLGWALPWMKRGVDSISGLLPNEPVWPPGRQQTSYQLKTSSIELSDTALML
jgi:hypothetical protein